MNVFFNKHFITKRMLLFGFITSLMVTGRVTSATEGDSHPLAMGTIERTEKQIEYLTESSWSQTIHVPDAAYIKVHFQKLDVLAGDYVTVSDPEEREVYTYPGADKTTDNQPGFWALSISGDTAVITLHSEHEALERDENMQAQGVIIDQYARGYSQEEIAQQVENNTESICGSDQRQHVACYKDSRPTEYAKSSAVAFLLLNNGTAACTAWRVGPNNYLLTNEFCLANQNEVNAAEVWFNYQRESCGSNTVSEEKFAAQNFLISNQALDFTLFTVNNFEAISKYGYLELDVRTPVINEEIYIPQHGGNDNLKKLGIESDQSTGNVCRIAQVYTPGPDGNNTSTGYFCDTSGLTYGAPVLARSSHKVIALHQNDGCMNVGVRIEQIWPLINSYLGPTIQFSAANYWAYENDGTATVVVTRVGDNSNAATVDYQITGGTAANGVDYTANSNGTLTWNAGDSNPKTIAITLIDDERFEDEQLKTIEFTLSNFTGAGGGALNKTTLDIYDDERFEFCSWVEANIPHNTPLNNSITLNSSGQLQDLNVFISAITPNAGDLSFTLNHADTEVSLINQPRNGSGNCQGDTFGVILDDEATPHIQNECQDNGNAYIWDGRYQPNESLKVFKDKPLNGTWTLSVADHASNNQSALYAWCLYPEVDTDSMLTVDKDSTLVCPGSNTDIPFQMSVSESISAAQVYLTFDPTKLQVNSITHNSGMELVLEQEIDNTEGYVRFAAASLTDYSPPLNTLFNLFTLNVTALAETQGKTSLYFDPENTYTLSSQGEVLPQTFSDITLALACRVPYQVELQGRPNPAPHPSWQTELTFSGDVTGSSTTNHSAKGELPTTLSNGAYSICVKSEHTLRNKIEFSVPLPHTRLNLGLLREGDTDNNNRINLMDFVPILMAKNTCAPAANYNPQADLNVDGCVDINDAQLFANNYGETGDACEEERAPLQRRSGERTETMTLALPAELPIGSSINVPIEVHATATQPVAAASAHFNFDPDAVQVNEIIAGSQLDLRLENQFDNELGEIDFAAVLWDSPAATETFTLATLNITVLAPEGEQTLQVNTTAPRQTHVSFMHPSPVEHESVAPAACQLYALTQNAQIATVDLTAPYPVRPLEVQYPGYDLQALAIQPHTHQLYTVSGQHAQSPHPQGYLYQVDGEQGTLVPVGPTGFNHVSQLAFSRAGRLWAWAVDAGLIEINVTTGQGSLVMPAQTAEPLAGLTLSQEQETVFLGALPHQLWQYDNRTDTLKQICAQLPIETSALEMLPNELLLLATPQEHSFDVHILDIEHCEYVMQVSEIQLGHLKDIALSMDTCVQ
ncbi:MAG: cohesin domain-containing protein [Pseudomonadota bacterium]|nr:cohesin domain-containing protein [Pseudomonadota bacterium]